MARAKIRKEDGITLFYSERGNLITTYDPGDNEKSWKISQGALEIALEEGVITFGKYMQFRRILSREMEKSLEAKRKVVEMFEQGEAEQARRRYAETNRALETLEQQTQTLSELRTSYERLRRC